MTPLSNEHDGLIAFRPCFRCRKPFGFHVDTVPSIPIDPKTNLPPDHPDLADEFEAAKARAVRQPLCPDCVSFLNAARAAEGRPTWN